MSIKATYIRSWLTWVWVAVIMWGCVGFGPPKVLQLYEGPTRPADSVANIRLHDMLAKRSNNLEKHWFAGIEAVDGTKTQGFSHVHLPPGIHTFSMYCTPTDARFKKTVMDIRVSVKGGLRYYPWARLEAGVIRGGANGAIPGTVVGDVVSGRCQPFLDTEMPLAQ